MSPWTTLNPVFLEQEGRERWDEIMADCRRREQLAEIGHRSLGDRLRAGIAGGLMRLALRLDGHITAGALEAAGYIETQTVGHAVLTAGGGRQ